jgi:hypothetical protein
MMDDVTPNASKLKGSLADGHWSDGSATNIRQPPGRGRDGHGGPERYASVIARSIRSASRSPATPGRVARV